MYLHEDVNTYAHDTYISMHMGRWGRGREERERERERHREGETRDLAKDSPNTTQHTNACL